MPRRCDTSKPTWSWKLMHNFPSCLIDLTGVEISENVAWNSNSRLSNPIISATRLNSQTNIKIILQIWNIHVYGYTHIFKHASHLLYVYIHPINMNNCDVPIFKKIAYYIKCGNTLFLFMVLVTFIKNRLYCNSFVCLCFLFVIHKITQDNRWYFPSRDIDRCFLQVFTTWCFNKVFVSLSVCQSVCLSVWLFVSLSVCQSDCLSICLFVDLTVCQSVCLSICLFVSLSVCQSVCLSICLFVNLSVCLTLCLSFLLNHTFQLHGFSCWTILQIILN